jgi:hypothetical protein
MQQCSRCNGIIPIVLSTGGGEASKQSVAPPEYCKEREILVLYVGTEKIQMALRDFEACLAEWVDVHFDDDKWNRLQKPLGLTAATDYNNELDRLFYEKRRMQVGRGHMRDHLAKEIMNDIDDKDGEKLETLKLKSVIERLDFLKHVQNAAKATYFKCEYAAPVETGIAASLRAPMWVSEIIFIMLDTYPTYKESISSIGIRKIRSGTRVMKL